MTPANQNRLRILRSWPMKLVGLALVLGLGRLVYLKVSPSAPANPNRQTSACSLPSIDAPWNAWVAAFDQLDSRPALKEYLQTLSQPTGQSVHVGQAQEAGPILLKMLPPRPLYSSGTTQIVVPGDLRSVDWGKRGAQTAWLNNGVKGQVEISPEVLEELRHRRDRLLELDVPGTAPASANSFADTLRGIETDRDYGQAFLCSATPLYKFSLSTAPPGGPSWMNKRPEMIAQAGTRVYKEAVFGNSGVIRNETRIKLVRSLSAPSYFVKSDELKGGCR